MNVNIETVNAIAQIAKVLTATGMLLVALYIVAIGNQKGWWISGREHKVTTDELERVRTDLDGLRGQHDALAAAATHALDRLAAGDDEHR